ncbi:hypothetical protein V6Z11_D04G042300 [Gossypium hirsutum]
MTVWSRTPVMYYVSAFWLCHSRHHLLNHRYWRRVGTEYKAEG